MDIKKAQELCVPANTKKAASWCLSIWKACRDYKKKDNQRIWYASSHNDTGSQNFVDGLITLWWRWGDKMELNTHQIHFTSCAVVFWDMLGRGNLSWTFPWSCLLAISENSRKVGEPGRQSHVNMIEPSFCTASTQTVKRSIFKEAMWLLIFANLASIQVCLSKHQR